MPPSFDPSRSDQQVSFSQILLGYPMRLFVYSVLAFVLCQGVFLLVQNHGVEFVARENGPVEQAQALMAVFASICLFYAAAKFPFGRPGLIICACMVGYAAARECDKWFETVFFDDAYKYLAGIPLMVVALVGLYRGRDRIIRQTFYLAQTPAITIFAIAGIYICSICQVIDRPGLWLAIGPSPEAELTKATVEEFAELFGYLLLAFSGIESIVLAFNARKSIAAEDEDLPRIYRAA